MSKKYLYTVAIFMIAIIIAIAIFSIYNLQSPGEMSDSSNWEEKELAGVKFKVPENYASGVLLSGSVIDGKPTGNLFKSDGLEINVFLKGENSSDWDNEYNSYMESNSSTETLDISGNDVTVAHNNTNNPQFSIAFFEVNGNKIIMRWNGNAIDNDIKTIVDSFYKLN